MYLKCEVKEFGWIRHYPLLLKLSFYHGGHGELHGETRRD